MTKNAIEAFGKAIGEEYALTDSTMIEKYRCACIPVERVIEAVLCPGSVEDVRKIVEIANEHKICLYPISTGNNWGYGAANPVRDHNVIVDLGRMNRIVEVDQELAYAVIEPGVTQKQLHQYLDENNIPLMLDPTGAGPNCSILGNTIERGYGIGMYGDHFSSVSGMEVVLANGDILETSFGRYAGAKATHTFKYGVGPYLDGIFTQSNYGIVTKIGVWLAPEPEHFETFVFQAEKENDVGPIIDVLRPLLLNEVIGSSVNLMHRNRVLSVMSRYPWDEMSGKTPLSEAVSKKVADEKKIGAWSGLGALYGTKAQVKAAKKKIKQDLRGKVDRLEFISAFTLKLLERFQGPISFMMRMNIPDIITAIKPAYGILKGIPNEVALAQPYWRMKKEPPVEDINPARDNCGAFWFSPVIPMTKEHVAEFIGIVNPIYEKYEFESCITLTTVTRRCFDCTLPLYYNKDDLEETKRANECYEELFNKCMEQGYIPYRFGIQTMAKETGKREVFWDVVEKIKGALDPNGILSPGRYSR